MLLGETHQEVKALVSDAIQDRDPQTLKAKIRALPAALAQLYTTRVSTEVEPGGRPGKVDSLIQGRDEHHDFAAATSMYLLCEVKSRGEIVDNTRQ